MKTALAITGKGDKQRHDVTVTLHDAVMAHGGVKGSDLALVNTDEKDDVSSIIEVHRGDNVRQWMPAGNRPGTHGSAEPAGQQTRSSEREERLRTRGQVALYDAQIDGADGTVLYYHAVLAKT